MPEYWPWLLVALGAIIATYLMLKYNDTHDDDHTSGDW